MAIAHVGDAGTATNKASGTTCVLTVTATIQANNVGIVWFAGDNIDTTTADSSHLSCSDSQGNTWTKIRETTYSEGVAADGICGALFYSRVATELVTAVDTITVTSDTALTSKAMSVREFTVGAALIVEQIATGTANELGPPSLALSGMTSRSYLLLRLDASEDNLDTLYATDADYTATTQAGTIGGALATNATVNGGLRVATLTADTCAPTAGENRDRVAILAALYETAATIKAVAPSAITGRTTATNTITKAAASGFQHLSGVLDVSDQLVYVISGTITASSVAVVSVLSSGVSPPAPTITDTSGKAWNLIGTVLTGSERLSCYWASFLTGASITISATFGSQQDACALSLEQLQGANLSIPIVQSIVGSA